MRVWTVSEQKAGTLTQCLGVAGHLDPHPRTVIVTAKLPGWRTGFLSPYRRAGDEPSVVISCGRKAERHVEAIKRRFGGRPLTVHLQPPNPRLSRNFDLQFVSRHDWTGEMDSDPRCHSMVGVPHRVTEDLLEARRRHARERYARTPTPVIVVLIGGSNGAYLFDQSTLARLLATIEAFLESGWTVLTSTSRRSEPGILEQLRDRRHERLIVWDRTGENPYLDYLAAGDAFLVTKDSITMPCEAAASGRPVFTFDLTHVPSAKLDKFERFHADMQKNLGLTRAFEGQIYDYDYKPIDEARRLATLVDQAHARRAVQSRTL